MKDHVIKVMVFPVVMDRCESWTIKKAEKVKVAQSCSTLCNPMDYTVHGILQARTLECVDFAFCRRSSHPQGWNPGLSHCRLIL